MIINTRHTEIRNQTGLKSFCFSLQTMSYLSFQSVSGAQGLLSIGAVEFLSHMRQDVDPELYQSIDNVIHQLLSLPQEDAAEHEQCCLYKEHDLVGGSQISLQDHNGCEQLSRKCWLLLRRPPRTFQLRKLSLPIILYPLLDCRQNRQKGFSVTGLVKWKEDGFKSL